MMSGPFHSTSIHWIIRFGRNAGVLSQAATEAKTVSEFKNALQMIWSALPEKDIDNSVLKTTTSDCRHADQPTEDILNI